MRNAIFYRLVAMIIVQDCILELTEYHVLDDMMLDNLSLY